MSIPGPDTHDGVEAYRSRRPPWLLVALWLVTTVCPDALAEAAPRRDPRARPVAAPPASKRRTAPPATKGPAAKAKTQGKRKKRKFLGGVYFVRDPEGRRWVKINFQPKGVRFSLLPGLGWLASPHSPRLNHFVAQVGAGLSLFGRWSTLSARDRMTRVYGTGLLGHLVAEVGVPVTDRAGATFLAFPVRLHQSFAFGRHGLGIAASCGPRWDLTPMKVGLQVTLGLGYALILLLARSPSWWRRCTSASGCTKSRCGRSACWWAGPSDSEARRRCPRR